MVAPPRVERKTGYANDITSSLLFKFMSRRHYPSQKQRTATANASVVPGLLASAVKHHQARQFHDAERLYRQILELDPRHADSLHLLGMSAYQQGHFETAVDLIRQAIIINKHEALYHSNLGVVCQASGDLDQAAACYQRAILLKPDYAEAHNNLGNVSVAQGKIPNAIPCYEKSLALNPHNAVAMTNLGVALAEQGRNADAIVYYKHALAIQPESPEALCNLANALHAEQRTQDALPYYARALTLKPDYLTAYCNLGNALQTQDHVTDALACYDRALALKPDFADAIYGKALALLVMEDFKHGWPLYEARWQTTGHRPMRPYQQPLWSGEKLSGPLLLWGEQGIGDEIMFAGLIPDVIQTGAKCILDCNIRLKPLFARSFPDVEVVAGLDPQRQVEIAAHMPAGSLPGLFRRNREAFSLTRSPYLKADPEQVENFRARYSGGQRIIGLAWHTRNQKSGPRRSIDLSMFGEIFAMPGMKWISLQYGDFDALEQQTASDNAPVFIDRSVDQLADIDSFAAQIAALDLVITIDNSTAHLAGALGVPVWLLLPVSRDWRWFREREDSLWYPGMRLFRQPVPGDWQSVLENVRHGL